jgi:hypothetical protein
MTLDDILRTFWARPIYQRFFLAFTVGLFLSCGARIAEGEGVTPPPHAASAAPTLQPVSSAE